MKKSKLLILPLVAMTLSGCSMITNVVDGLVKDTPLEAVFDKVGDLIDDVFGGLFGDIFGGGTTEINGFEIKGGSSAEQQAIVKAADKTIASVSANAGILPGELSECKEDDGDYIYLNTVQAVNTDEGNKKVTLEWGYDENDPSFDNYTVLSDEVHARINLKYPGFGNEARDFNFYVKKMTCGKAVCETKVDFNVHLLPAEHKHDDVTIAQIYALNTAGTGFNIVDYTQESPYYTPNYGQDYYYVNVPGKVVYLAPDGNWGLIADGKHVLEIYAGSELNLDADHFPGLEVGAYVTVTGNMSIYNGNMQIGFITKIKPLENHSSIAEPLNYPTLTGTQIDGAPQYADGYMNGLFTMSGTLKTKPTSFAAGARATWTITADGKEVIVAYDYHVDRNGDKGVFDSFKSALDGKSTGSNITIKGTLRYNGSSFQNDGHWEIVPFLAGHIA